MAEEKLMDKLVALCRRRGFIFQSSEIYGGINGFWDYGPLGVELKKNIKDAWWLDMVRNPPLGPDGREVQMVGVDCSIIMNPKVWEASGHVGGFSDPMVDCKKCKRRFRADKVFFGFYFGAPAKSNRADKILAVEANDESEAKALLEKQWERIAKKERITGPGNLIVATRDKAEKEYGVDVSSLPCPADGCDGELTDPRAFNLMFQTYVGAVQDASNIAYLRPETAQGIFANFRNVRDSSHLKIPFGIAQVGKAFRNEINPRNYTFRSREFEQMEIEFFCHPSESMKWYQWWRDVRIKWYSQLGIRSERLRPREQGENELAFYSKATTDIEYLFPFSDEPQELEGVAHRGAYDLTQHMKHSGKDLTYFDEEAWERDKSTRGTNSFKEWLKKNPPQSEIEKYQYVPHVIEPSAGADRFTLAVLCEAYTEDVVKGEPRTVMKFHPRLAPIKAAVLPLVNKDGMPEQADALYRQLKKRFNVFYDDGGAIGRRYRRQDEIGTPFCITVDGDTMKDGTVTIRERDSTEQERVSVGEVEEYLRKKLEPQG
jgi:glycyl-tRNA synthetase